MKKKILYILVFLTVILTYELINSYSVIDIEISEQEQEEINSFYEINPESISRGNVFDLKYVFCVSEDQEFTKYVEVVMKNKMPYEIGRVRYYDKNNRCFMDFENNQDSGNTIQDMNTMIQNFGQSSDNKRLGWFIDVNWAVNSATTLNSTSVDYDFSEITIELEIKKGLWNLQREIETHHIVFDENAQLSSIRKIKDKIMNGKPSNAYEKRQIDYYFGILFRKDFDQWYDEIKGFLLNTQEVDVYFPYFALNLPSFETLESDEEIKRVFNFDDAQLVKYKEVVQLINDFNIFPEYAEYLEK